MPNRVILCFVVLAGLFGLAACNEGSQADVALDEARSITAAWLTQRVQILSADDMEGRDNLSAGGERARHYLIDELEALGVQPAGNDGWLQSFGEGINIVGVIPGSDGSSEYVAIGAHYDHLGVAGVVGSQCDELQGDTICNGASDNGSGCAAVLAIAKTLIEGAGPRRSVLVILFDAEEDGLLGSHYYASTDPTIALESMVAFFNIDTIGVEIIPGEESSFVLGVEYNQGLRELVWEINQQLEYTNYPVSSFFDGSDDGTRSDHYSFRLEEVSSIFFGSGSPPEYHTPADELGIISMDKFLKITQHAFLMTRRLVMTDMRPEFVADPQPHLDDAIALKNLGDKVLDDPGAVGIDDPSLISILEGWMEQLQYYLDNPPQSQSEWEEYDSFIRTVIKTALMSLG
jgi:peptidase M28-like protein